MDICVHLDSPEAMPKLMEQLRESLPYSVSLSSPSEDPNVKWIRVWCPLGFVDVYGAYDRCGFRPMMMVMMTMSKIRVFPFLGPGVRVN